MALGRTSDAGAGKSPEAVAAAGRSPIDRSRFAELVTRYQSRVHRLVAGILGPSFSSDAEDATQEIFLHVYRKLPTFRGESRLSTWLYRLAYNRALDYRRRLARNPSLPLVEGAAERAGPGDDFPAGGLRRNPAPLGGALSRERAERLRSELEELTPPQRTAVHLHYWLGCSIAEISELTDTKPATVKSHLFRARKALALRMKGSES